MTEEEEKAKVKADKEKADKEKAESTAQQISTEDKKPLVETKVTAPVKVEKEVIKEPVIDLKEDDVVKEVKPEKDGKVDEGVIRNAIKKGSEITKNQLYPEIKRLKEKINTLADDISGKVEDASQKESDAVVKLREEKAKVEDKLKVVEDALVETVQKVESIQEEVTTDKLDLYRQKVIAENKGEIIERLVGGNSKEEIDASIVVAKTEHELVVNTVKQDFNLPEKKTVSEIEEEKKPKDPTTVDRIEFSREGAAGWKTDRKAILQKVYDEARENMQK